jgi:ferrous iron transport protein A
MTEKLLTELSSDQEAEIVTIDGGWIMQARLKELGIVAGRKVKKISRVGTRGPIIILVNRAQVAVGAGMASRIAVKVKSNA